MTPLHIEIMLHYNSGATDYRDGDFTAVSVSGAILLLEQKGLIENMGLRCSPRYLITEGGRMYVESLCQVRPPVKRWVPDNKTTIEAKFPPELNFYNEKYQTYLGNQQSKVLMESDKNA